MYEGPGIYRHYKGGKYEVIGIAIEEARLEPVVIYRPLDNDGPRQHFFETFDATMWSRPLDNFNEVVPQTTFPPDFAPRFEKIT